MDTISCVAMGTLSMYLSAHLQPLLHAWTSYLFNKHKGRAIRFAKQTKKPKKQNTRVQRVLRCGGGLVRTFCHSKKYEETLYLKQETR